VCCHIDEPIPHPEESYRVCGRRRVWSGATVTFYSHSEYVEMFIQNCIIIIIIVMFISFNLHSLLILMIVQMLYKYNLCKGKSVVDKKKYAVFQMSIELKVGQVSLA
jgi:hypothetical protein